MNDDFDLLDQKESVHRNYGALLLRRRWHFLVPLMLCGVAGAIVAQAWRLPYRSEALIMVEQQKVPEQYVTPNVITNLQTRLDTMKQEILSRTRLQALIEQFNLYPRMRTRETADSVVDGMRKDISVDLVQTTGRQGDITGFRIAYSSDNPRVAQRITNELTSMFIDDSMRQRSQQSINTTDFFENQLSAAQKVLATQEEKLSQYKLQFLGELPEQEASNLQILSSLQAQLYASENALQRAQQQQAYLESLKEQYESIIGVRSAPDGTPLSAASVNPGREQELQKANIILLDMQKELGDLEGNYGPKYPGVISLKEQIVSWQKTIKDLIEEAAAPPVIAEKKESRPAAPVQTQAQSSSRIGLAEVDSRLKATTLEIADQRNTQLEIQKKITTVQAHLNMTPVRQQQLAEITRSYENSRAQYQSLLQKKLQSELASNLERRQQGEQFRILDPASFPERPEGRMRILFGGWFLGLVLGAALAVLRELASPCVYDDNDVKLATDLPVFRIPVIRTAREMRQKRFRLIAEAGVLLILAVVAVASSARTYLMS